MRGQLAYPLIAATIAVAGPAASMDVAQAWNDYLATCSSVALAPVAEFEKLDLNQFPKEQWFSIEAGNFVRLTIGDPEFYTLISFNKMADRIGSTCSASIAETSATPDDVDTFLRSLDNAQVVGGLVQVIIPSGTGFTPYPGHTWVVDLDGWVPQGASLHVQHDGYGTITMTSFGSQLTE